MIFRPLSVECVRYFSIVCLLCLYHNISSGCSVLVGIIHIKVRYQKHLAFCEFKHPTPLGDSMQKMLRTQHGPVWDFC